MSRVIGDLGYRLQAGTRLISDRKSGNERHVQLNTGIRKPQEKECAAVNAELGLLHLVGELESGRTVGDPASKNTRPRNVCARACKISSLFLHLQRFSQKNERRKAPHPRPNP
ncbi:MAG: hypothetical protein ABJA62_01650 [Luteimonas sp.]